MSSAGISPVPFPLRSQQAIPSAPSYPSAPPGPCRPSFPCGPCGPCSPCGPSDPGAPTVPAGPGNATIPIRAKASAMTAITRPGFETSVLGAGIGSGTCSLLILCGSLMRKHPPMVNITLSNKRIVVAEHERATSLGQPRGYSRQREASPHGHQPEASIRKPFHAPSLCDSRGMSCQVEVP